MKLFISWSGSKSREVAVALRDWLPGVINSVEPFVSAKDIYAGTRWQAEIAGHLETSRFGIVCVTAENQSNRWLNFEAGALAKAVASSRVVPLAIDLKPSDIQMPLAQFQAQPATEDGILEILASINVTCDPALAESLLRKASAMWWPDLRDRLAAIGRKSPTSAKAPARSDRELIEELLDTVRSLARASTGPGAGAHSGGGIPMPRGHPVVQEVQSLIERYAIGALVSVGPSRSGRRLHVRAERELTPLVRAAVEEVAARYGEEIVFGTDGFSPGEQHEIVAGCDEEEGSAGGTHAPGEG